MFPIMWSACERATYGLDQVSFANKIMVLARRGVKFMSPSEVHLWPSVTF